jgi:multicomponent Na+:H+ antiporter subunit D
VTAGLLPLPVMAPIAGAVAAPLVARVHRRLPVVVSLLAMATSATVLLILAPGVFGGRNRAQFLGHVSPVLGIEFQADPFGLLYALACALIGALLLLYTLSELGGLGRRELGGYAALYQLLLAALIGSALTADLFNMFVWFEVAALAGYGLTGFFLERPVALEAAFKILVLTTVASFGIFLGTGILYARYGALNFARLHAAIEARPHTAALIALGLLVAGFATKAGLMPFHGWLADAHTAAPGPVSALFSGLMVNLGIVAIARLTFQVYGTDRVPILGALMVAGLASAVLGAVLALAQDDLKRLLAYDTISQMGILAIGLATGTASGLAGAAYHLVNHALFKSLLFLCAGAIVHRTGATKLSEMGGLARRMPVLAGSFVVGTAAIAGLPPLNGYVSLSLIHEGLRESHQPIPYALMLLAQLITVAALGRAGWLAFFRPGDAEASESLRPGMAAALLGLGACCVGFGVLPEYVLGRSMKPAALGLLHHGDVAFHYLDAEELIILAVSVVLAYLLARIYLRVAEPRPVRLLRALHTGSVNDYTAFATAGTIALIAVLLT